MDLPARAGDVEVAVNGQVAAITDQGVTVGSASGAPDTLPATRGARDVTWDSLGHALFGVVGDSWVRIDRREGATAADPQPLQVPAVGGRPALLSVSPSGDQVVLFATLRRPGRSVLPRVYVGRFDGRTVWSLRELDVPRTALSGPMGWVGDNGFLLAPGIGRALIVRTDGSSSVDVRAASIPEACDAAPGCSVQGPWLLGTNGDGSLLFWKVRAVHLSDRPLSPRMILYYETWLDGTHALELTGVLGRIGPPVAPR